MLAGFMKHLEIGEKDKIMLDGLFNWGDNLL